ncbi:MAG: hypothetical protein L7U87_04730 [Chlamydiales bacterium]|nr:hypothetical protein [Chlamydiales bacterium]
MITQKIKVKLFMGIYLSKDIQMQLSESAEWKSVSTFKKNSEDKLQLIHYEKKAYLGLFLSSPEPSVDEVKKAEGFFFKKLHSYLPQSKVRPLQLCLFSQIFIS